MTNLLLLNNAHEDKITMRKGRLGASILQEVSDKMEDIVKHKITKNNTLGSQSFG